jgi:hypothetical protein
MRTLKNLILIAMMFYLQKLDNMCVGQYDARRIHSSVDIYFCVLFGMLVNHLSVLKLSGILRNATINKNKNAKVFSNS